MKTCPACLRDYDDAAVDCEHDGAQLIPAEGTGQSTPAPTGSGSASRGRLAPAAARVRYDLLPQPIAACWWYGAHRAEHALPVYKAGEGVVRAITALVLADVLDEHWPEPLERMLRCSEGDHRLARPSLGIRVELLRRLVDVHARATNRILPDLRAWWSRTQTHLDGIVKSRNQDTHGAALSAEPADAPQERLAELLRDAAWLQEVQLVTIRGDIRYRHGHFDGTLLRLRGTKPFETPACESPARWKSRFEPATVYLGRADGTAWTVVPWMQVSDDRLYVCERVVVPASRLRLVDTSRTGATLESEPVLVPERNGHLSWSSFLDERTALAKTWRLEEAAPDPRLVLPLPADRGLKPGHRIDVYTLVQRLGEGGFATVWMVEEDHTRQRWALKILRPEALDRVAGIERFDREVALMRTLHHRGCRRVLGPLERVRFQDGDTARVMIRMPLRACTLGERAAELREKVGGSLPATTVARWGIQALEALEDIHAQGVIHRDIKPSNFLLDGAENLEVADFGVARDNQAGFPQPLLTVVGEQIGSDAYMAPEQRRDAAAAGPPADIYALAVTLHEVMSGKCSKSPWADVDGPLGALLRDMAAAEPTKRPTANNALLRMRGIADESPASNPTLGERARRAAESAAKVFGGWLGNRRPPGAADAAAVAPATIDPVTASTEDAPPRTSAEAASHGPATTVTSTAAAVTDLGSPSSVAAAPPVEGELAVAPEDR